MPKKRVNKAIILVIEDYRDSREMLRLLLESLGYSVQEAANGDEALEVAASNLVDLILTDLGLPGMDGLTIVRQLRKLNERLKQVPIIMLSAFSGDEYSRAATRAGCTEFLTKPLDVETLHAMIERLLKEACNDREDSPNGIQFHGS